MIRLFGACPVRRFAALERRCHPTQASVVASIQDGDGFRADVSGGPTYDGKHASRRLRPGSGPASCRALY